MRSKTHRDPRETKAVRLVIATAVVAALALALATFAGPHQLIKYASLGIVGVSSFLIEYWMRRMSGRANPFRIFLPVWSLIPFSIVCVIGATQHLHTRDDALGELRKLAGELETNFEAGTAASVPAAPAVPDPQVCTLDAPDGEVAVAPASRAELTANAQNAIGHLFDAMVSVLVPPENDERYYELRCRDLPVFAPRPARLITDVVQRLRDDRKFPETDARRFEAIARTIARDLDATHDPRCVAIQEDKDTWPSFMLALAIQGLFVLWIPCLLAVAIAKAMRPVSRDESFEAAALRDTRDSVILGEKRSLFIPRLCFGILVLLGTNYIFAPFGLKTTYMLSIVDQHASAGQTSFALWTTDFGASPPIVSGFLGFLLYAMVTATQRFAQDDFDDQAMFSLLARGLVVLLISLALSASPIPDLASRIFVFFAGIFPMRALEAIGTRLNVALDPDFDSDKVANFDGLAMLEPVKAFALRTAGIRSTYDLASTNIATVAARVRIDPLLLGHLVDRAILIDTVGLKVATKLTELGVQTASDLAALAGNVPALVTRCFTGDKPDAALADTIAKQMCERLRDDPRRIAATRWLDCGPAQKPVTLVESMPPAEARAGDFVYVDLTSLGGSYLAFPLRLVPDIGALVDSVFAKVPAVAKLPNFDYGRSWVLALGDDWVWHDVMRLQRWGTPCADPSLLREQGIRKGTKLKAVDLRRSAKHGG